MRLAVDLEGQPVRHVAASFMRHFHQRSFDEWPDLSNLPQDRLAPFHEPVFNWFLRFHF